MNYIELLQKMELSLIQTEVVPENIRAIATLFPNTLTERIIGYNDDGTPIVGAAIDFDILKQELSDAVTSGPEECYTFTWPGKKKSILLANSPSSMLLHPCREESVNFDVTENLYIEGDNLDALKLLQEGYSSKVRMIYIDPPYNTGRDYVYTDRFSLSINEYMELTGHDNDRNNGRYHTDWLNMMYPRLKLARDLLREDGVIFISIDDNEAHNMRNICDEIFGAWNFIGYFFWTKTSTPPSLSNKSRKTVEFILCYEKKKNNLRYFGSKLENGDAPLLNSGNARKELRFPAGSIHFTFTDKATYPPGTYGRIVLKTDLFIENGKNSDEAVILGEFKWGQKTIYDEIAKGTYFIVKSDKFSIRFQRAYDDKRHKAPCDLLDLELNKGNNVGTNEGGVKDLDELGMSNCFDFPKPVSLIHKLIQTVTKYDRDAVILDFFSGSATTAHAVMQLNAEDGGNRRFILVQFPEIIDKRHRAYRAGYRTICDIGKERIRRAGSKINGVDTGFRVLKVDSEQKPPAEP